MNNWPYYPSYDPHGDGSYYYAPPGFAPVPMAPPPIANPSQENGPACYTDHGGANVGLSKNQQHHHAYNGHHHHPMQYYYPQPVMSPPPAPPAPALAPAPIPPPPPPPVAYPRYFGYGPPYNWPAPPVEEPRKPKKEIDNNWVYLPAGQAPKDEFRGANIWHATDPATYWEGVRRGGAFDRKPIKPAGAKPDDFFRVYNICDDTWTSVTYATLDSGAWKGYWDYQPDGSFVFYRIDDYRNVTGCESD